MIYYCAFLYQQLEVGSIETASMATQTPAHYSRINNRDRDWGRGSKRDNQSRMFDGEDPVLVVSKCHAWL